MAERSLIRALRGGNSTKIVTLNGKKLKKMPSALEKLTGLRSLDLQNNQIPKMCPQLSTLTQFQHMKLREFYCEGNPLFRKQPIYAGQQEDLWNLREITARFIMNQLEERNSFIMNAIEEYPDIKDKISQGQKCAICEKSFLTTWLECVQFVHPSKTWKISKNLKLIPLRVLLCSQRCFCQRGPNVFGIA
ncbi:leucine-rich repeat-containing protein 69 isoform X2 [Perognathus longimembris pacificus]|uniref:leucine-rich repeat-containing protein 69 isoform X2 n=1 Tax=Perognathus longimembris pacificus TaxID=214514 RepID=UPI00201A085E|nr:leucine-rich repeat-containing protein 69 isoform X2 [Perognathus longimembris pacificus]